MSDDMMPASLEREGVRALGLMEYALELLDACDCRGDVGAHLDFAISNLRDLLGEGHPRQEAEQPPVRH